MISVGFEIGTGKSIQVPSDRHIAITGQTQLSGKTTTLEKLVDASGVTAVAFVTKRGEGRFQYGRQVQPYFRTPLDPGTRDVDWQFVESVLGSTLNEKMKSDALRLAIIRATAKAKSLEQVHGNIIKLLDDAKGGSAREGVYTLLDAYFRKVIPELAGINYADRLELHAGLNVMDISECSENVQHLVVRSVAQTIMEKRRGTRLILPEAWKFIPEKYATPCKSAVVSFIRTGAGIHNLLWLDSQDFAGIDKIVLRAMGVWFIGAQQEYNEVSRVLETAVVPNKLQPHEIKTLGIGQFFVLYDGHRFKTYIQPLWADAHAAALYSAGKGKMPLMPAMPRPAVSEHYHWSEDHNAETEESKNKKRPPGHTHNDGTTNESRTGALSNEGAPTDKKPKSTRFADVPSRHAETGTGSAVGIGPDYETFKTRILKDAEVLSALVVLQQQQEIKLRVKRVELPLDAGTLDGVIALLIRDGWFGQGYSKRAADVQNEALARGIDAAKSPANIARALDQFQKWGFLMKNADRRFALARPVRVTVEEST